VDNTDSSKRAAPAAQIVRASERGSTSNWRRFVAVALCAYLAILAGVLAFNAVVDPYGISGAGVLPTAIESDRSTKLGLMADLGEAPDLLILGSSRARLAEPSYVQSLTGHDGFNAAVTGGTAADAWVMTRYLSDVFPAQTRHYYLWFVDAGVATDGVNPLLAADRRAQRYLRGGSPGFGLDDVATYISVPATRAALRVARACVLSTCSPRIHFNADGSVTHGVDQFLPEHAAFLEQSVAQKLARVHARGAGPRTFRAERRAYFENTLAFMTSQGARPVIVLNPVHPAVLAELEKQGFARKKEGALAYLRGLQRRFDFVVVDCEDIDTWGGSRDDFLNATHVNRRNMRRMLRYIVAHSDGALS
jgi:hypothetical protein